MVGLNKFSEKDKRRLRRQFERNRIAQDLHTPKYRQRTIEPQSLYEHWDKNQDHYYGKDE
jgi:hypothetical protein